MTNPYNEALGATLIDRSVRERIVLVGVSFPAATDEDTDASLDELAALVDTAGADEVARLVQRRDHADHTWFIGKGKAEELRELCYEVDADTVVFDNELAPAQQFNLEKLLGRTAIDRTAVILDIFAQNASTLEGRTQVELALLRYRLPRLRRGAEAKLAQQRGGVGTRFGGGESKLEVDRRRIQRRISRLESDLKELDRTRHLQRKQRERSGLATVSIVGYTNAGKSSLLNALTDAGVLSENRLFATLDPTTRRLSLPGASPFCSPTPSGSCADSRTASWKRSRARSKSRPTPTSCCTWSTPAPPTRSARSTPFTRCCRRSGPTGCPSCSCSTRPTWLRWKRNNSSSTIRARSRSAPRPARGSTTCCGCCPTASVRSPLSWSWPSRTIAAMCSQPSTARERSCPSDRRSDDDGSMIVRARLSGPSIGRLREFVVVPGGADENGRDDADASS